jgi:hypothetical protein
VRRRHNSLAKSYQLNIVESLRTRLSSLVRHGHLRLNLAVIAAALMLGLLSGCLPEASFELASDSPLPRWFSLPDGLTRADVSVKEDDYTGFSGRSAVFTLRNKSGDTIDEVTATIKGWEPITFSGKTAGGGFNEHSYPLYERMTARGVTEVIESKELSDIFYVNEDPQVRAKLGLASPNQQRKAD